MGGSELVLNLVIIAAHLEMMKNLELFDRNRQILKSLI